MKIPLDAPARPVDVGLDFTIEFWLKANYAENNGTVSTGAASPHVTSAGRSRHFSQAPEARTSSGAANASSSSASVVSN